jgi:N-acetylgalactosamine-N,N'-diacetylbacillosaminyl-diphospho-undecaprenol 4-alpha-N-acetylgalactosaminyltransferase
LKQVTLFINSLTLGGAERVLTVIASELSEQNIDVNLLCIEKDNVYELPNNVNITYLSDLTKHDSSLKKLIYLPYLAFKLKKYIKKHKVSRIQSHIYRANFTNILAKVFGAKHEVQVVEVTSISNLKDGNFSKKINFILIKLLYKYTDKVIFISERMREEFLKNLPFIKHHQIIHNPHDIKKIQTLSKENNFDGFTFNSMKKYLVTVGRLSSEKRITTILESLTNLSEDIELIVIGDGDEETNLKRYTEELNLTPRVHFLGRQDNPFKYLAKSDIFLLASEGEGFPNVIIEAMACSLPVISTDCISGPREILAPSSDINFQLKDSIEIAENGILFPIGNQNALTESINHLLSDRKQYSLYQRNGLQKSKTYDLNNIINKYKEVLCVAL